MLTMARHRRRRESPLPLGPFADDFFPWGTAMRVLIVREELMAGDYLRHGLVEAGLRQELKQQVTRFFLENNGVEVLSYRGT